MSESTPALHSHTGSPLGDPRAEIIGRFTGLLSQQSASFQAWIGSVRAGRKFNEIGYVPAPDRKSVV